MTANNVVSFFDKKEQFENQEDISVEEEERLIAFDESKEFATFFLMEILKSWHDDFDIDLRFAPDTAYTVSMMAESILSTMMELRGYDTELMDVCKEVIPLGEESEFLELMYANMEEMYGSNDNEGSGEN